MILSDIDERILNEIKFYAKSKPKEESCGVVARQHEKLFFKPCENLSSYKEKYFLINPYILIEYDVVLIYHSHVASSSRPSVSDIKNYENILIPFLIYSLRDDDFYIYQK